MVSASSHSRRTLPQSKASRQSLLPRRLPFLRPRATVSRARQRQRSPAPPVRDSACRGCVHQGRGVALGHRPRIEAAISTTPRLCIRRRFSAARCRREKGENGKKTARTGCVTPLAAQWQAQFLKARTVITPPVPRAIPFGPRPAANFPVTAWSDRRLTGTYGPMARTRATGAPRGPDCSRTSKSAPSRSS